MEGFAKEFLLLLCMLPVVADRSISVCWSTWISLPGHMGPARFLLFLVLRWIIRFFPVLFGILSPQLGSS